MISHKHKNIFVHIPKAGGISIEQIFLDDLGLNYDNRSALIMGVNTNKDYGPPRLSHLTANEYVNLHYVSQEIYNNYFKFTFVRNPYDRTYSFYKYLGYRYLISYEVFVRKYLPKILESEELGYFFQPMYNYVYINSKKGVDFIGKLENIKEDMKYVFEKSGLDVNTIVPHVNNSSELSFKFKLKRIYQILRSFPMIFLDFTFSSKKKKKNYDSEMRKVVEDLYVDDFSAFNYDIVD